MSATLPLDDDSFEKAWAAALLPPARRVPPAQTGGHGPRWIVTYSDMVTLLIAFFIAIITFSSKATRGNDTPRGPALLSGPSESGVAGPRRADDIPRDAVVWRPRFPRAKAGAGAEFAPVFDDPAIETAEGVLHALATAPPSKVGDPYTLRLPFGTLFGSKSTLTPSGQYILRTVAANLRNMPYDFHVSVRSPDHLPRAARMGAFLSSVGGIHPGRIGIGVRASAEDELDTVVLEFTPQI